MNHRKRIRQSEITGHTRRSHPAAFSVVLTAVSFAAAYMAASTDTLRIPLHMKYGTDFSVTLDADGISEGDMTNGVEITPDGTVSFDPYITNTGNYDVYAFIEIMLPNDSFVLTPINPQWVEIASDKSSTVYAYGTHSELTALPALTKTSAGTNTEATPSLCSQIHLQSDTGLSEDTYYIEATGYAIAVKDSDSSDPDDVWNKLKGDL